MGKELLTDPDVTRWHSSLSRSAARGYLRWLSIYCEFRHVDPKGLVTEFQKDRKGAQDGFEDWLNALKEDEYAPMSMHAGLNAVKSWFRRNELVMTREIKVKNVRSTPTLADERTPTRAELLRTLNFADLRARAVISFIALAGIRFESMAGLSLRDLPELEATEDSVKILKAPMRINVRAEISKNGLPRFTFLVKPEFLEAYLRERLTWDRLTPSSPVFVAVRTVSMHGRLVRKGDPLTSGALSMETRRAMRLAGLKQRPYVWRSYFGTALLNGRINSEIQAFLMGHAGTIEATYTTHKRLSEEQTEQMRKEVAAVFAETPPLTKEDVRRQVEDTVRSVMLGTFGEPSEQDVEAVDQLVSRLREKGTFDANHETAPPAQTQEPPQKLIPIEKLDEYLPKGWTLIQTVNGSRAVVQRPTKAT
ncbi:MAG: hypothetical protein ABSB29_08845 [Nitrososphaerales archaeon]